MCRILYKIRGSKIASNKILRTVKSKLRASVVFYFFISAVPIEGFVAIENAASKEVIACKPLVA